MNSLRKVAILVRTVNDWSRQVLMGVAQFAQEQGGWEITHPANDKSGEVLLPPGWRGDGIICRVTSHELERTILNSGIPAVNVSWLGFDSSKIMKVVSDEKASGEKVAAYFLERHYQNVAYIGFPSSLKYETTIQESIRQTLAHHDIELKVFECEGMAEDQGQFDLGKFAEELQHMDQPLAVITWDSHIARQLIGICREMNRRIPDDVSIVSLEHDDLVSSLSPVAISTLDQDPWQVGYTAAKHLERLMEGQPKVSSPVLVPPLFVTQRRSSESSAVKDKVVRSSYRFIHEHVTRGVNVDDVLRELHIPRRTLEQKYQEFLGLSPARVIRRARTRVATRLLRETTMSIQQIAERSGFGNANALSRTFKRETGQTPSQFRRADS